MSLPSPDAAGTARAQRLRRDLDLLAIHEPALRYEMGADGHTATARGSVLITLPDGSMEPIDVRIEFGTTYPKRPPRAYDAERRWTPALDRHIEDRARFCLFLPGANEPDLKPEGSLLKYISDLKSFLRQQLILDSQRRHNPAARFPGPEYPHGAQGAYAIFAADALAPAAADVRGRLWEAAKRAGVSRTARCPCDSGDTSENCHRETLKQLLRALWEAPELARLTYSQLTALAEEQRP